MAFTINGETATPADYNTVWDFMKSQDCELPRKKGEPLTVPLLEKCLDRIDEAIHDHVETQIAAGKEEVGFSVTSRFQKFMKSACILEKYGIWKYCSGQYIPLLLGMSELEASLGNSGESYSYLEKVYRRYQGTEQGEYTMAMWFLVEGRYEEARSHLQIAIQLNPGETLYKTKLAAVQLTLDNREEAVRLLEEVLMQEPDNENAKEGLNGIYPELMEQNDKAGHPEKNIPLLMNSLLFVPRPEDDASRIRSLTILLALCRATEDQSCLDGFGRLLAESMHDLLLIQKPLFHGAVDQMAGDFVIRIGKKREALKFWERALTQYQRSDEPADEFIGAVRANLKKYGASTSTTGKP